MTLVAGVDSSTQSCKVVVRDLETGETVRTGRASHPDGTEIAPAEWWRALGEAIADAGGLDDVSAVSIAGQQHGMVVLDADGEVIRDALLWNDTRSAQAARDLIAEFGAAQLAERTGSVPVASFTATKLRWLRDAEPDNAARVAAVALPHDWLTWRLLGYGPQGSSPLGPQLDALVTDRSDASGTSYWNPTAEDYDRDLLVAALGTTRSSPRARSADAAGRTVADVLPGVPADLVVGAGAGDNAGAALGLGAVRGDVVISIGTSGTRLRRHGRARDRHHRCRGRLSPTHPDCSSRSSRRSTRPGSSTRSHGCSASTTPSSAPSRRRPSPGRAASPSCPTSRASALPTVPDATATLSGMTLGSTSRPNLARAAVEGLLCGLAGGLDAVRATGVREERIVLIGGAAQNEAVRAIAAQVFDAPVEVPAPGEYVASGAAVQAGWALTGTRPEWSVGMLDRPAADFRPEIREGYRAAASAY